MFVKVILSLIMNGEDKSEALTSKMLKLLLCAINITDFGGESMNITINHLNIKKFRKLKDLHIPIGKRITVISGQNGVGKSNILSLIASASGTVKQKNSDSDFQPDFDEYFFIYPNELRENYSFNINYLTEDGYKFTKSLRLKDDNKSNRGIRFIPTTIATEEDDRKKTEIINEVRKKVGCGKEAKVPIPTKFLSLSRLFPIGEGEVESKVFNIRNRLVKNKVYEKYKEWYNFVLPNSIPDSQNEFKELTKSITNNNGYFMNGYDTKAKSQSIGQDNLRHIISTLLEFYLISRNEDYFGGILCIDELDSSLHSSAQLKLFLLLDNLCRELKIQAVVSSHSLTILKEIIRKNLKEPGNYELVYLKGPRNPYNSQFKSYQALKADLFQEINLSVPKVKIYCEDKETARLLRLLIKTTNSLKIEAELSDYEILPVYLGCEQLKKLPMHDNYFTTTCMLLDGDARIKEKVDIKNYINNPNITKGYTTGKQAENIVFLPGFMPPESFLYSIINDYVINDKDHLIFWRSLDENPETTLYTSDKILEELIVDEKELSNDRLKGISDRIFTFVEKSDILLDYYNSEEKEHELVDFIKKLEKVLYKCNETLKSRRV